MREIIHVDILDTTLRDGQQSPGAGMTPHENLEYAKLASTMGINILEAGFPAASERDFEIVREISTVTEKNYSKMMICALCQLRLEQVIKTIEALKPRIESQLARLHIYVPVDPVLMKASLGSSSISFSLIAKRVKDMVLLAVNEGLQVEFSPEGYSQMGENFNFTTDLILTAVESGATIINCPDTIGGASRWQSQEYFVDLMNVHADIVRRKYPTKKISWSVHCHNDLGLALENSVSAVFNGPATQIEACTNGVGERAGNAAIEQCVMMIDKFGNNALPGKRFQTSVEMSKLKAASDFISKYMLPRQPHWPITGENAARHSSGGHTNAVLKNPMSYQPYDPEKVGSKIEFVFGPLSGSNHAKSIINSKGYNISNALKTKIANFIKSEYSDRRKGITDDEVVCGYKNFLAPIKPGKINISREKGLINVSLEGPFFERELLTISKKNNKDLIEILHQHVISHFPNIELLNIESEPKRPTEEPTMYFIKIYIRCHDGTQITGQAKNKDKTLSLINAYIEACNEAYFELNYARDRGEK